MVKFKRKLSGLYNPRYSLIEVAFASLLFWSWKFIIIFHLCLPHYKFLTIRLFQDDLVFFCLH